VEFSSGFVDVRVWWGIYILRILISSENLLYVQGINVLGEIS
jgi:hypothetical protein